MSFITYLDKITRDYEKLADEVITYQERILLLAVISELKLLRNEYFVEKNED